MNLFNETGCVWLDGNYINKKDATISVLTHSLHYGLAVFEGLRAYKVKDGTSIFRLKDHTKRLFNSAKILSIKIPFTKEEIDEVQLEIVRKNNLDSGYIRPLVFYGEKKLGVTPSFEDVHVMITAWSWGSYLGEEALNKGIKVKISSFSRHHVNVTMCKAKNSGNYANSILANQEAISCGYDEAILLDTDGFVAEGSGENIFLVRDNILYTPDLSSALEGITRDTVLHIINDLGLKIIEKRITRDELYIADEAFFTGTAAEITPIRQVDNVIIGEGTKGKVTDRIQKEYFSIVLGENKKYKSWLYFI